MKNIILKAVALLSAVSIVNSITAFKPCLECLYENQGETAYFCSSSETCRYANDTQCASSDIIWSPHDCVEAIDPCETMEFNVSTFGAEYNFEYTLVPGHGCWLEMGRTANGSWGVLNVNVTYEIDYGSLLIYDTDVNSTNVADLSLNKDEPWSSFETQMVYADSGWKDKKIFIANRNENAPAYFTYRYNSSKALIATIVSLLGLVLML